MEQILQAIFKLLFELVNALLTGASELIVSMVPTRRNERVNADFLPAHKALSKTKEGFVMGDMRISLEESYQHMVVTGQSGGGKSTCVGLPSILQITEASLIIHDPSGMEYERSSGAKQSQNFAIKVFDYRNPKVSEKYNPLSYCKTRSEIKQLAKTLITATLGTGGQNEVFWNTAAENLVSLAIAYIRFYTPKENKNLYNVLIFLKRFVGSPKETDRLILLTEDDELIESYKAVIRNDPKVLMNITTTAITALSLWEDEVIAEITSDDTISFDEFRTTKTVLYIRSDINQMKYFAPLTSIFFVQFFASVMCKIPEPHEYGILGIIDEASSLTISSLGTATSNLRKYRSGLMLLYQQAESQLTEQYGVQSARAILANCFTKLYLPGQPLEVCRQLEILLGKFSYVDDKNVERTKNLMSMNEIRMMDESIILIGNKAPIKLKLVPYFKQKKLLELSQIPPFELKEKGPNPNFQMITDGME
ncbi:MAG: type IV secretory system conjugative DNA transfer family protein [Chitinophagaceae bacterium]|nr:type IV secretory system conjugative DNA transfer family protein [Chitinophagaceae bacterium]